MKLRLIPLLTASIFFTATALAQTPPAGGEAQPTGPAGGAAQPTGKEVRAQCKAQAESQGLSGPQKKGFVQDCLAKARPDLAAASKCRADGKAKGLIGDELKAFVRNCKQH